jgi:hypothetical protein
MAEEPESLVQRDEAADQTALDNPETWKGPPSDAVAPPPNNIMLHGYRTLNARNTEQLRMLKDIALQLWNELHVVDESSADSTEWESRELEQAALHLETTMLWVEKHFAL